MKIIDIENEKFAKKIEGLEVYDLATDSVKEYDVEISMPYNTIKASSELLKAGKNQDMSAYGEYVLREFVTSPKECKKLDTFMSDFEALSEVMNVAMGLTSEVNKKVQQKKKKTSEKAGNHQEKEV